MLRTDSQAQLHVRSIVKDWIETDEVNVLAHASEDQLCISLRNYELMDVHLCGKVLGLPGIDRPSYPHLPLDVNLSSGQEEQKKTNATTMETTDDNPTNTISTVNTDTPSTSIPTTIPKLRSVAEVAVYGHNRQVDIARETDLPSDKKKTSTSADGVKPKDDLAKGNKNSTSQRSPFCSSNFLSSTTVMKPKPFSNLGLSCWINATITAFFGSTYVRNLFTETMNSDALICASLRPVANSLSGQNCENVNWRGQSEVTNDHRLAVTFQVTMDQDIKSDAVIPFLFTHLYYEHAQDDAHIFFMNVIANAPRMKMLMQGKDEPVLSCSECDGGHHVAASENFTSLQIAIRRIDNGEVTLFESVQAAIDNHFRKEPTDAHFRWSCVKCGSTAPPCKRSQLISFPKVLTIQLKRYTETGAALHHVVTPDTEIKIHPRRYALRSIICHIGGDCKGGHYTARIHFPTRDGGFWYYNNTTRKIASEEDMRTDSFEKSYIMIYDLIENV